MKIILSRKGFDSTSGGGPSPILDGRRLFSLPIEYGKREKRRRFSDLRFDGKNLGKLIARLHPHIDGDDYCHLDPDLRADILPGRAKSKRWRPLFGQADSWASHLLKMDVGEGDLFLFFGLFRESRGWKSFLPESREMHVVFGWLQVDKVILDPVSWAQEKENSWASEHPHTYGNWWEHRNILFVSKRELEIVTRRGTTKTGMPGAGVFEKYHPRLRLTSPKSDSATKWRVPKFLAPDATHGIAISSIGGGKWTTDDDTRYAYFDPGHIRRWQEAVITGNRQAVTWALQLIKKSGSSRSVR
jgi:hypothetical protein